MKKRVWVIGNGPSLNHTPLHDLIGEDCFAMNGIWRIYDKTEWRPTHYFLIDFSPKSPVAWRDPIIIHQAMGIPMWLLDIYKNGFPPGHANFEDLPWGNGVGNLPDTTWVPRCKQHHFYYAGNSKSLQEWHLPELCTGLNTIGTMMQVAVLLGYDEIYLLGCDLGFVSDWNKNYFDPNYNTWESRDLHDHYNKQALQAHQVAKKSSPIPIYNCTIGGKLDVHPRREMQAVLNGEYERDYENED